MTKIRTAEETLRDKGLVSKGCKQLIIRTESGQEHCVNDIMIEYTKQFIDLAAEEAQAEMRYRHSMGSPEVDKESILKLKERVV